MTKRQEWLIATLRKANGGWLTESEIFQTMIDDIVMRKFDDKDAYVYKENPKGSHCAMIWDDADKINNDKSSDAIILTKDRQFAIAMSESDVYEMLLKPTLRKAVNAFKRYWNIRFKLGKQNQGVIHFTKEEVVFIDLFATPKEAIDLRMGGNEDGSEKA